MWKEGENEEEESKRNWRWIWEIEVWLKFLWEFFKEMQMYFWGNDGTKIGSI